MVLENSGRVGYQSWLAPASQSRASTRSSHPASKEMSDAVIDLCTSDSDNEESPRPTSSAKRPAAGPPQVDSDSDDYCFVCPPPAPAAAGASSSSNIATVAQEEQQEDGDGDGDIEYVGHTGDIALSDYPHARYNCVEHKFLPGNEVEHCAQCYCYVCDGPARDCSEWASHCKAIHTEQRWVQLRKQRADAATTDASTASSAPTSSGGASSSGAAATGSSACAAATTIPPAVAPPPPHLASAPAAAAAGKAPLQPRGWTCERLLEAVNQVYPVETPEPAGLEASIRLKPYQKQSLAFMLQVERTTDAELIGRRTHGAQSQHVRGGWLCDEVGMGKTAVCISLCLANPPSSAHGDSSHLTVVVGPPTLLGQWYDECQKFAPGLRVATYHSMDAASRQELATNQLQHYDVVLSTFFMDFSKVLRRKSHGGLIHRLIVDESHLATQSTVTRDMVSSYRPQLVWMLTGTPVSSTTRDLEFGMLTLLGSPPLALPFTRDGPSKKANERPIFEPPPSAALASALRKLMMRHTKQMRIGGAAALALPDKDVSVVWLQMNDTERELYHKGARHEEKRVHDLRTLGEGAPGYRLELAVAFRRQACSNAYKVGNCYDEADRGRMYKSASGPNAYQPRLERCTKLNALMADLEALRRTDPSMRAVVFTHYLEVQAAVVACLEGTGFQVYKVSGMTDIAARAKMIRSFQEGGGTAGASGGGASGSGASGGGASGGGASGGGASGGGAPKVFVFTVKLGSVGLTLTAATRVYLLEPAFDPAAEAQMAGRIHRLGQSRQVLIKKFAFRNSIDENIVTLHERIKHGQIAISNGVIPPQGIRLLGRR